MRFRLALRLGAILLIATRLANAQCFTSSSGAVCCPEEFPCSDNRCVIDRGCELGAAVCTSNVCQRPTDGGTNTPGSDPTFDPSSQQGGQGNPAGGSGNVYSSFLECGARRTRKEIRDMSDDEWNRFVNAVNTLRSRSSLANPAISQYEDLARIHSEFVVEAHGGSFFLPWHRLFVLLLENLLREQDSSVTIPYWNWAVDGADPAMSSIWNRAGGSVRDFQGRPGCIPFGPFANIQTNNTFPHCVSRGFFSGQSGSMIPLDNWLTIQALIQRDVPYPRFAAALESTHGSPHVGIGGDMSVLGTAPNDPMFFLHHAFVDYIYMRWQNNGNGIPGRFGGTNPGVQGNVNRDSMLTAFDRTVRYSQKLRCINYQDFSGSFGINSGGVDLGVVTLPDDFITSNHLNKTRIDEGHAVLEEALNAVLGN